MCNNSKYLTQNKNVMQKAMPSVLLLEFIPLNCLVKTTILQVNAFIINAPTQAITENNAFVYYSAVCNDT